MKITLMRSKLQEGLGTVERVVGSKTTLPILSNVLIRAEKGNVSLATTDLEIGIERTIEAEVIKPGVTTLPVRRLAGIVRELPESKIELEVDEKDIATLKCESSFYKVIGLSEEEFPPLTRPEGPCAYSLEQGTFVEMLRKTAYAASTDETRPVLNGVLLGFKAGRLSVVATDGRRLALVEQETEVPKEAEQDYILPSKVVAELLRTLGGDTPLKIRSKQNQILFEYDHILLSSKLIEGPYPNYRQVIPAGCEERVVMEREVLLTALRRVSVLSTDRSHPAKLTFSKNRLVISVSAPDVGEARESIALKYSGKEVTIGFNADYLMDPLKTLTNDEVYFEFTDELSPAVLKCDSPFLYVVMPMRLG